MRRPKGLGAVEVACRCHVNTLATIEGEMREHEVPPRQGTAWSRSAIESMPKWPTTASGVSVSVARDG